LSREELKYEILLLPVSVALSLFRLECASLNNELAGRAQQIHDLYVQFSVQQHRDLVKESVQQPQQQQHQQTTNNYNKFTINRSSGVWIVDSSTKTDLYNAQINCGRKQL